MPARACVHVIRFASVHVGMYLSTTHEAAFRSIHLCLATLTYEFCLCKVRVHFDNIVESYTHASLDIEQMQTPIHVHIHVYIQVSIRC